jgi:NADPH:quinone reductase-like Zn-dependent oxidoreductase
MKAAIWTKYGPPKVIVLKDIEKPSCGENEILIKIHAASVTMGDCEMRKLKFSPVLAFLMRLMNGIRKPKRIMILGQDLAGEIEDIGNKVTKFKRGEQIFGSAGFKMGAYAEYRCLPEEGDGVLITKPSNMSFEEAAAVPLGGLNALYFLEKGNIQDGQKVLVNGGGGSIGSFAIQIAKAFGGEVTGVDSTDKIEMMRSIGADYVVDYTQQDFTKQGEKYDIILDVVRKSSFKGCIKSLNKNGVYLQANHGMGRRIKGRWISMRSSKKVISGTISEEEESLNTLKDLIEAGKIKSFIDKKFTLEEIVEAHEYVETGKKKGNVVIAIKK